MFPTIRPDTDTNHIGVVIHRDCSVEDSRKPPITREKKTQIWVDGMRSVVVGCRSSRAPTMEERISEGKDRETGPDRHRDRGGNVPSSTERRFHRGKAAAPSGKRPVGEVAPRRHIGRASARTMPPEFRLRRTPQLRLRQTGWVSARPVSSAGGDPFKGTDFGLSSGPGDQLRRADEASVSSPHRCDRWSRGFPRWRVSAQDREP